MTTVWHLWSCFCTKLLECTFLLSSSNQTVSFQGSSREYMTLYKMSYKTIIKTLHVKWEAQHLPTQTVRTMSTVFILSSFVPLPQQNVCGVTLSLSYNKVYVVLRHRYLYICLVTLWGEKSRQISQVLEHMLNSHSC